MRFLIRGGTVVTATGSSRADVLIDGETVAALLDPAHTGSFAGLADRSIDATGKYVIPGGIDVHTHLDMPFGGTFSADDFETGTRAAAWGGTTARSCATAWKSSGAASPRRPGSTSSRPRKGWRPPRRSPVSKRASGAARDRRARSLRPSSRAIAAGAG